jgi:hypothetical protein
MLYSKSQKQAIFRSFIQTYFEMLDFIHKYIGKTNKDFNNFYQKNKILRKANVKIFIKKWYETISIPYSKEIMSGNIDYFINKDYEKEVSMAGSIAHELSIQTYIVHMKNIYSDIDEEITNRIMMFIQQCTKMSILYYTIKTN